MWTVFMIAVLSLAVYCKTAYPTINWWDSSSYSLATSTTAIIGPPGSLLLTLLGWPIAHFSAPGLTAHALNLFACVLAAATIVLSYGVAVRILDLVGYKRSRSVDIGAALGALTLAFTTTFWEYAVQFTPYILTPLCTVLILLTMVCWWKNAEQPDAWRYFALLGLLEGIDFSVHRTNSLLLPGILMWVLIRHARSLLQWRTWVAATASLIAALSLQLLLIPIARNTHSPLNWNDTGTLKGLWEFISLSRLGGGFLISLWPRNAPFWSVQVTDVLRTLSDNFFHWNGVAGAFGVLAALASVVGLAALWQRDRRFGFAFSGFLLLQAVSTVLYFNIPEHYFRSLDRHYLPICVTCGIAVACGLAAVARATAGMAVARGHRVDARAAGRRQISAVLPVRTLAFLLAATTGCLPFVQLVDNWHVRNASNRYFASDYARNVLTSLPPNAIYFTVGDNDTFPILYMQAVEGLRPDVRLVNLSLLVDATYVERLLHFEATFPLSATRHPRNVKRADWTDSTLSIPVVGSAETLGMAEGSAIPATFVAHPTPAYVEQMILGDLALVDIVRTNAWHRPLTFALTAVVSLGWLKPFTRLDGAYYRVVPVPAPPVRADLLRTNLFRMNYRGYGDNSAIVDDVSRTMGTTYFTVLAALLDADRAQNSQLCEQDKSRFMGLMPASRLQLSANFAAALSSKC